MKIQETKYFEVKEKLADKVKSMKPGTQISGERELARQFGYSYMTIRRAVDALVEDRILYRIPRKGTFVAEESNIQPVAGNIGFFLYNNLSGGIASPYYSLIFKSIQRELTRLSYNLVFFTEIESVNLENLDGVIATAFPDMKDEINHLSKYVPIVMTDNDVFGVNLPSVVVDNYNSTYHAVEYGIELGHEKIGYVSGSLKYSVGVKRLAGFKTALENYNLDLGDKYIYNGNYEYEDGYNAAEYFLSLEERPTFIHCANDLMAMGLIKGFIEKGINVPGDMSVCGFDNIEPSKTFHPSITTMAVDFDQIAELTVETIVKIIKGEKITNKRFIIPAKLIVRESTSGKK